jgi:uncharacterized protein DUF3575
MKETTDKKIKKSDQFQTSNMKKKLLLLCPLLLVFAVTICTAQKDSTKQVRQYKNVIRYNLSGALIFGIDRYLVFGYERVIKPNQTISVNVGGVKLPKLISVNTDSFSLQKDSKSNGFNVSVDYRFYLGKENKFAAPRGAYIGPYYSYNNFTRDNQWQYTKGSGNSFVNTHTTLNINTVGFQFGYQFLLWKRMALDFALVGPGFGFYNYKANIESNVSAENKQELLDGLKEVLTQKFPGMNFVFADKQIDADGVMKANTLGYRYIIHIGYAF